MTATEAVTQLKSLWETAMYYARQSMLGRNSDPLHDSSTALWVRQLNALSFEPTADAQAPMGYQVLNGNASWRDWAKRFEGAVTDLIGYRETFGFDGHDVKTVGSITTGTDFVYIGPITDDPLQGWWLNTAGPKLEQLAVSDGVDYILEPFKRGAEAVGGILDFAEPWVLALVLILFLILAVQLTS